MKYDHIMPRSNNRVEADGMSIWGLRQRLLATAEHGR
jgi:hypothetical protein